MFNFDLMAMAVSNIRWILLLQYLGITTLSDPKAIFSKAMIGAQSLDVVQIALILWSFLLPKTVVFSLLIDAMLWPTVVLCGAWFVAVVLCCLLVTILSVSNHLLGGDRYAVAEDDECAAILLELGYAALAIVFVGCFLAGGMSAFGCITPFLLSMGLETLGKLSYLAIFVLGAAIHRFCIKPNPGMFVVVDQWLPLSAEDDFVKNLPHNLQAHITEFLSDTLPDEGQLHSP